MLTLNDLTTDADCLRAEYHVLAELRRIEGEGWLGLPETE